MPLIIDRVVVLDCETGGTEPGFHDISEVGAIVLDMKLNEIARFMKKIQLRRPERYTAKAIEINGYDPAVWAKEAVPFGEFKHFLKKQMPYGHSSIQVGHNGIFDRQMIVKGYYEPFEEKLWEISFQCIDTWGLASMLQFAGKLEAPNLQLVTVSKAMGVVQEKAHTVESDCEASLAILKKFVEIVDRGCLERFVYTSPKTP